MPLMVVGEHLLQNENQEPFSDKMNGTLKTWLRQVGIDPNQVDYRHVFMEESSSYYPFFGKREYGAKDLRPIAPGRYLYAEHKHYLKETWDAINRVKPNLVLALGDVATWALTSETSVTSARGYITTGNAAIPGVKVLPTYTPRQIYSQWENRPILLADLTKAAREKEFPEVRRPQRFLHLEPSLQDLDDFYETYIKPCTYLSCDIENMGDMITCVGFAPSVDRAIVVPFYCEGAKDKNYWNTAREEIRAWKWVKKVLSCGKKVGGQNFQHDMQYLHRVAKVSCPDFAFDTMMMHHAHQIEFRKGLGFLGSIYTNDFSWKLTHKRQREDKTSRKGED